MVWNWGAGLINWRIKLLLQGVLTGWKNGKPKKSPTYAAQRRAGKWWGPIPAFNQLSRYRHSRARFFSQVQNEKRVRGYRHKLQQGKLQQNIKKKSQFSNKWSHNVEGTSEATNPHPSLEKVRAWPHLPQSECWEGTAIITTLLIRLFQGTRQEPARTTTCNRQKRRMQPKPWHLSWADQSKVNIAVMKAMLLWNSQLCSSGACQHCGFVDVHFSSGQSAGPSCFPRNTSAPHHQHNSWAAITLCIFMCTACNTHSFTDLGCCSWLLSYTPQQMSQSRHHSWHLRAASPNSESHLNSKL